MSELVVSYLDVTKLALASFLARYREPTLGSYRVDLRCFLRWCREAEVEPLRVTRAQLELYLRRLEASDYAPATISRRFCTVATFLKFAVIDGHIPTNPADAVTRPKVEWQGQKRTVLHPLEFAALLSVARSGGGTDHALVALLGMIGLRVSEACHADIDDIRYQSGYEILHVIGKGAKPADIPLPIPVLRAIREATDSREHGPILLNRLGNRMDPAGAARRLRRLCARAGINHDGQPAQPATNLLHHRAHRWRADPGHAGRDASQRSPNDHALRHGSGQPRPPRCPHRRCLPGWDELRLTPEPPDLDPGYIADRRPDCGDENRRSSTPTRMH
jgi:site-specific recombinase XerD